MATRAEQRVAGGSGAVVGRPGARVVVRRRGRVPVRARASGSELGARQLTGLGVERSRVVAIQRSRILAGMVCAVDELGYADTSVAEIVARTRVSRRTFYELFANREECLTAVLDDTVARVELELKRAGVQQLAWRERMRAGLWTILSFLDREPVLARVCVVQALGGGAEVRALREVVLARLAGVLDGGRLESARGGTCTRLMAEGLVGAAYMILYTRLATDGGEPLEGLFGELMSLIVLPYLGPGAARREQTRPAPQPLTAPQSERRIGPAPDRDPLQGVNMRLTYRTARVLEGIQQHPGASNRQVAEHAGVADPGQVSKLLRRLERLGLLENHGLGHTRGEPNQWRLTVKGTQVTESIRTHQQPPLEVVHHDRVEHNSRRG